MSKFGEWTETWITFTKHHIHYWVTCLKLLFQQEEELDTVTCVYRSRLEQGSNSPNRNWMEILFYFKIGISNSLMFGKTNFVYDVFPHLLQYLFSIFSIFSISASEWYKKIRYSFCSVYFRIWWSRENGKSGIKSNIRIGAGRIDWCKVEIWKWKMKMLWLSLDWNLIKPPPTLNSQHIPSLHIKANSMFSFRTFNQIAL